MEHWQFLIQKQGDGAWRALESSHLEIIEGKYRVVARSNHANTDVEVRVTHISMQEASQKHLLFKRKRRTNSEGLIAVIPFTYLKPGILELRCFGDLMADMLGKSWEYKVELKIVPLTQQFSNQDTISANSMVLFNSSQSELFTQTKITVEDAIIDAPITPVWMKATTVDKIIQNFLDIVLPSSESLLLDENTPEDVENIENFHLVPPLLLSLEQDNYVARWGESLIINGRVQSEDLGKISGFESVCAGEIHIQLYSPQELEIYSQTRQSFSEKLLPFAFTSSIKIPDDCQSKLILGEVSLYGILDGVGNTILLANCCFSIVAEFSELLAVVTDPSEPNLCDYQLALLPAEDSIPQELSTSLNLDLLNLVKSVKTPLVLALQPAEKKVLPPQINPREFRRRRQLVANSPQLPQLPGSKQYQIPSLPFSLEKDENITSKNTSLPFLKRQLTPLNTELIEFEDTAELVTDNIDFAQIQEQVELVTDNKDLTQIQEVPQVTTDDIQQQENDCFDNPELISIANPYVSPLIQKWIQSQGYSLPEPISVEFEDYYASPVKNSQQTEIEFPISGEDKDIEVEFITSSEDTEVEFPVSTAFPPVKPKALPPRLAEEIVVDEVFVKTAEEPLSESLSDLPFIPVIEFLPVPQLYVPEGDLISGKSVLIRVQLPEICPNIAIKLWVKDYQTRWLVDGPHLLTNLLPTKLGALEVLTQLEIPFGCLEIRLEAVAVDLTTQQESDKTTVTKTVIPANLASLQLDEITA